MSQSRWKLRMHLVWQEISWRHLLKCLKTGAFSEYPYVLLLNYIYLKVLGTQSLGENVKPLWDQETTFSRSHRESYQKVVFSRLTKCRLIVDVIYSRYVNVGLFYLRQLFFAKFDLKVHTDQGKRYSISISNESDVQNQFKNRLTTPICGTLWGKRFHW